MERDRHQPDCASSLQLRTALAVLLLAAGWILRPLESVAAPDPTTISAEDRHFWAFRLLRRPPVPTLEDTRQVRTPIDAFVLAKLAEHKLTLADDSDSTRLLRRLYFDLIGLPPSPEAVDAYVSDTRPGAYGRLVDGLLASSHFGARWGRHWLDTVGYTDTVSYDGDTNFVPGFKKGRWRYRDYVIDSFNADKPYDRFVSEQVASDELIAWRNAKQYTPEVVSTLAATGFWRNAEDRSESAKEIEYKWSVLHDAVQTFGTSLLGLTLRCARCHTHKYEPIPQEDYYQLLALITPAFNLEDWKTPKERVLPAISAPKKAEVDAYNATIEKQVEDFEKRAKAVRDGCKARLRKAALAKLSESLRETTRAALALPVQKRDPAQLKLAEKFLADLDITPQKIEAALSEEEKATSKRLQGEIETAKARKRSHGWIHALYDVGPPPVTRLLERGDFKRPGREVEPGFLSVLSLEDEGDSTTVEALASSSGRRRALARWLTAPNTPASSLVARVVVNRVWQHLTGVGIVPSSENLGKSGDRPTHPELLEWLATELVAGGWRLKPLMKQIVMSSVYRQTSRPRPADAQGAASAPDPRTIDPKNALLWHARLRRLESEAIRDSMLVVSGMFDGTAGGPPVPLHYRKDGIASFDQKLLPTPESKWRRSVYLFQRRVYHLTLMGVFDQPSVAGSTCRRASSAVVLQSLCMLNGDAALDFAEHFARRVYEVAGDSHEKQIEVAFRLALTRPPQANEIEWSAQLLQKQAKLYRAAESEGAETEWQALLHLCRVLFNSTEFLYVE